jgi:Tol biopolymer transport system component
LLATAAGLGIYKFLVQKRPGLDTQKMKVTSLTDHGEVDTYVAISPDGKLVAYGLLQKPHKMIVKQLATGSEVKVFEDANTRYGEAVFSPDGNFLYYLRVSEPSASADLYSVPSLGGTSRRLATDVGSAVSFSPDGRKMAFVRHDATQQDRLVIAEADGGGEHVIYTAEKGHQISSHASWSPDLGLIALPIRDPHRVKDNVSAVAVISPQGKLVSSFSYPVFVDEVQWLPKAGGLLLRAFQKSEPRWQIWFQPYPSGQLFRITNDLTNYWGLSATADGTKIISSQVRLQATIYVGDSPAKLNGNIHWKLEPVSREQAAGLDIFWTSDGRLVQTDFNFRTTVSNADGSNPVPVLEREDFPHWSAASCGVNGTLAVKRVSAENRSTIWKLNVNTGELKQITHGELDIMPSCTPDGNWIVYGSRTADGQWRMLRTAGDGGSDPIELRPARQDFEPPVVSPDGKSVAQFQTEGANSKFHLEVLDLETGKRTHDFSPDTLAAGLNSGLTSVGWTSDGRNVTYIGVVGLTWALFMQRLSGGEPVQLTHFDSEPLLIEAFAWSRDGKKLAITRERAHVIDVVMFSNFR